LYSKIGTGMVQLDNLKDILSKNTKNKWVRVWDLSLGRPALKPESSGENAYDDKGRLLLKENIDEKQTYELGECCNPIPGDEVIGEKRDDGMITVHRTDCSDAIKTMSSQGDKLVTVSWTQHKVLSYLARIHLSGWDRFGVYNSITSTIAQEFNISMRTINLHGHDGIFDGTIDLYVHNTSDLNNLIMNLIKLKGVESVHRVEIKD
jgi:GTP diphosphokinase / guanosine-3',5'-bis(diphosphate) 3'-diphosphatase